MRSSLYRCRTVHQRFSPKPYRLAHEMFMFYLDLDEIPSIGKKSGWIGYNKRAVYEFRDSDHLQYGQPTAKQNVMEYARQNGVTSGIEKVMVLTHLRTLGYIFNPVSFYFCLDAAGKALCAVAEVGNTFGELKAYFLGPESFKNGQFGGRQTKFYYISPFVDLDAELEFGIKVPDQRLSVKVDDWKNGERFFTAVLSGEKKELNGTNLLQNTLRFPLVTLQVIAGIHWHALMLYFKKMPFHAKEDNPHLQKNIQRSWVKK